jgi:RimJ/RimL family protein N-acetyltransferase
MDIAFAKLTRPTPEIASVFQKWENDPQLTPFIRPNQSKEDLERPVTITTQELEKRLEYNVIYLIYGQGQLVGEMNYQVDPAYLFKKEAGTAWIGIDIGEEAARGQGIGSLAMQYLENQIKEQGLHRIELGVFEFNENAIKLYQKMGYQEITRFNNYTYWRGRMWQDIRMEKYLK